VATMISNGIDVVAFLKEQHEQIRAGFERVRETGGTEREWAFFALRRLLAVHETAEEEIVHPAARTALPDGDVVVDARLREEQGAKRVLSELEPLDVDSPEFASQFAQLESSVLAHAQKEETEEFERLRSRFDAGRLDRMRQAVVIAESIAPTRPHAGLESQAANLLIGPFASMLDRARDLFAKAGRD
jgi:hemerythrin superfamily protein